MTAVKNLPEFSGATLAAAVESLGVVEDMLGELTALEKYREQLLRAVAASPESTCRDPACVRLATSVYLPDGDLKRFLSFVAAKRVESGAGYNNREEALLDFWKSRKAYQPFRQALEGPYETDAGAAKRLRAELTRLPNASFSLRGRGGRRRKFEAWREGLGLSASEANRSGRRRLLSNVFGVERPDLAACVRDLTVWLGHVRDVRKERCRCRAHVTEQFGGEALVTYECDLPIAVALAEGRLLRRGFGLLRSLVRVEVFFPELLCLSELADAEIDRLDWLWDEREWKRRREAAARRVLAGLSGGVLTGRQIKDQLRG